MVVVVGVGGGGGGDGQFGGGKVVGFIVSSAVLRSPRDKKWGYFRV